MSERVSLDNVTATQFEQLVELLSESISDRHVKVRIWMPSAIELIYDSEWMSDLLQRKQLPVDACLSQLGIDIPMLLTAILTGRRDGIIWHLAQETELTEEDVEEGGNEETIRSELLERCVFLEEQVVNEGMRHRYAIKITAKNNVLTGTEWEVVQRRYSSTLHSLDGLTYATLSLFVQKPPSNFPGIRPDSETLTVILTSDEILELQMNLQDALNAIRQVTRTGE